MFPVHGSCDPAFTPLKDALAANFRVDGELGGAVALWRDGTMVVDLWAGHADAARTRQWRADTLVNVFSIGKGATAACLHHLVERGEVDLDAPVTRYWPAFGAAGKASMPVHMVLSHRAGLPAVRPRLPDDAIYSWEAMTAALAAERPWWEPGSGHGYHVNTFGFLVGEIVRRVTGASLGDYLRRLAASLGAEFHVGLPASFDGRVAEFVGHPPGPSAPAGGDDRSLMIHNSYFNPAGLCGAGVVNTRRWRATEVPSTNGHSNARSVARFFGALATGEILGAETLARATAEAAAGDDLILGRPTRFGLGFQLTQPERPLGPSPRAFGHFGAGGSLGLADPDARLGFGYTMNVMGPRWQNPKVRRLVDAVYGCL